MTNKEKYVNFMKKVYIPIYSQDWWMDTVCMPENWDVWLYEKNNEIFAAMPYYFEKRGKYFYITKAIFTQNNGIIFRYPDGMNSISKQAYEEKIIDAACEYIASLNVDVYEQQYQYTFDNYLPFLWNGYKAIPRYTYVIEKGIDVEDVWSGISSKYRRNIRKGQKAGKCSENITVEEFYEEHRKIYLKQGKECPFTFDVWQRLYKNCVDRECGKMLCYRDNNGNILSVLFLVWDDKAIYHLLGGSVPEFQHLETFNALVWEAICFSRKMGLAYDFEGSVIKRISKSFREYGGKPKLYFRIRKIFNEDILKMECNEECEKLGED